MSLLQTAPKNGSSASSPAKRSSKRRGDARCETLCREQYAEWDALVDRSVHGTVFHHSWWLAAVTPTFDIVGVRDADGALVGGMPLPRVRRLGLDLIHAPAL